MTPAPTIDEAVANRLALIPVALGIDDARRNRPAQIAALRQLEADAERYRLHQMNMIRGNWRPPYNWVRDRLARLCAA